jgi:hypothetical protein
MEYYGSLAIGWHSQFERGILFSLQFAICYVLQRMSHFPSLHFSRQAFSSYINRNSWEGQTNSFALDIAFENFRGRQARIAGEALLNHRIQTLHEHFGHPNPMK